MKKILGIATILLATILLVSPAGAQDPQVGSLTPDPATVPAAGDHTITVNGAGFIPDSEVVVGSCTAPGDTLVAGVSTTEAISAAITETLTGFLDNCDLAALIPAAVDSDGNFTSEVTATVGDNFILAAGALDQSQAGGIWVPIVDPAAAAQLAVTGAHSWSIAIAALAAILAGLGLLVAGRRHEAV